MSPSRLTAQPRADGDIGRIFEAELRAAIEHAYPALAEGKCKIPDVRRASDAREKKIADLIFQRDDGVTVYLEAKATAKPRWELRNLKDHQRASLRHLVTQGCPCWVVVLFRVPPPAAQQRCIAVPGDEMLRNCYGHEHEDFPASASADLLLHSPWRDLWPHAVEVERGPWGWDLWPLNVTEWERDARLRARDGG